MILAMQQQEGKECENVREGGWERTDFLEVAERSIENGGGEDVKGRGR